MLECIRTHEQEATYGIDSIKRSDRQRRPKSKYQKEASMERLYYIGLDIHKKTISYCVKKVDGNIVQQGKIAADRKTLLQWMEGLPGLRNLSMKMRHLHKEFSVAMDHYFLVPVY